MGTQRRCCWLLVVGFAIGIGVVLSGCHYSCRSYCREQGLGPVPPEIADKFNWSPECKAWIASQRQEATPAPEPAPEPTPEKTKPAPSRLGPNEVSRIYPCEACGILRIDKVMPRQVNVNTPFEYEIIATNLTDMPLSNVAITESLADGFIYEKSQPNAQKDGQVLMWALPQLGANESKTFVVTGHADQEGQIANCASASYVIPSCARTEVVKAQLGLTHVAPKTVLICDEIPVRIVVQNSGSGPATNVKVAAALPEGLTTLDGKKTVNVNVGTLGPGESKEYVIKAKAAQTGQYELQAMATADHNLKAQSSASTTVVTQPILQIAKEGPETQYLGRPVEYTITVKNTGSATAQDTIVEDTVPAGVTDVRATDNAIRMGTKIRWTLGNLAINASKILKVAYMPTQAATLSNTASATAVCATAVSASAQTAVRGIPALLLEVIDLEDPIEVGQNDTYRITVTNQGTAVATNVIVKGMPEGEFMQYVSSTGPTRGSFADGVLTFTPLPSLAPKAKATWEITVKALKAGDVRFKVTMNSDQLDRDVEETESTNLYQ